MNNYHATRHVELFSFLSTQRTVAEMAFEKTNTNFSDDGQVPFDDETNLSDGGASFNKSNLSDGGYSRIVEETFEHQLLSTEEIQTNLTKGGGSVQETTFSSDGGGSQTVEETAEYLTSTKSTPSRIHHNETHIAVEIEEEQDKSQTNEEIESKEDSDYLSNVEFSTI